MKMGLVVAGTAGTSVVQAFREECSDCVVVQASEPREELLIKLTDANAVIATTPVVAEQVAWLQDQLGLPPSASGSSVQRTRRPEQLAALGKLAGASDSCTISALPALRNAISKIGYPVLLRPAAIGDNDSAFVCQTWGEAENAFAAMTAEVVYPCDSRLVVTPYKPAQRFGMDVVSLGGRHVVVDQHRHRVDEREGQLFLRHRISIGGASDLGVRIREAGFAALDALGFRSGATHVIFEQIGADLRVLEVLGAPIHTPVDASFMAFSHGHQHLLAEQTLRPTEFARRLDRPPPRTRATLGIGLVRTWQKSSPTAFPGFRVLRRLVGFHSFIDMTAAGVREDTSTLIGMACFVDPDPAFVENSLTILHEMEDAGSLFDEQQLIG